MTKKNKTSIIISVVTLAAVVLPGVTSAQQIGIPQDGVASTTRAERQNARAEARTEAKEKVQDAAMERMRTRANNEITRRVTALNAAITRVNELKRVSTETKSSVTSSLQSEISALEQLKTKIAGDTDVATLKEDVQSITKSYRIFALVIPQAHFIVAADRIMGIAADMSDISSKLETRINEAATAGEDVTKITPVLTEMKTKIATAKTKAQTAIDLVMPLDPDNGDKAVMEANKAALKNARTSIKEARESLMGAHKDAQNIRKQLKAFKPRVATTTPAVMSTTTATSTP